MAIRATRCVCHDNHAAMKHAKAQDPLLAIFFAPVFNLEGLTGKDQNRIPEIETTLGKSGNPFGRVKRDSHQVIVAT